MIFLQFFQEQLCERREDLILFPYDIHIRFKCRLYRTETKPALFACIYKMLKGEQIAEILFYKHRSIVSKTERPFQSKLGAAYSAPAGDVIFPQRRSQRRGGRKAPSSDGRSSHPGRREAVLNKRAKCHWGRSSPTPFLPNGVNENRPHCHTVTIPVFRMITTT